ncbi:MAG: trifunctional serine/threonine-protein kinase/ATP-binding protein/sensor histidine kinase [Oscillatoriaceae cyanobacterium Prado104]|jgi:predicted ATPase/signal transduction histidine kinase|nr:trifunctional serine/threonine-protein kinase/ATP-binding protein/sensor histidine kinase [Oscillatoriaceae cyanobacterium Prado104]
MVFIISSKEVAEPVVSKNRAIIDRGVQKPDSKQVIIETLSSKNPAANTEGLNAAYCIVDNIYLPHAVTCYGLELPDRDMDTGWEDIGGQSLEESLLLRKLDLKNVLRIAIAIVKIITKLHQIPIIHKDIKPGNIIVNFTTGKLKLCGFSFASRAAVETAKFCDIEKLKGTIAYISPEQTGRTNRLVDCRSDYYCLGVTCYELLTGRLPFEEADDIETIGCHLAEDPIPPHQINPKIPEVVSSIVMELLEKNPADRYQSAAGLIFDLETCLSQLEKNGKIDCFRIRKRDKGKLLALPQKLYGREQELHELEEAFDRIRYGAKEVMMIYGASGNGKSSIAREARKLTSKAGGYFISGKFEKLKPNIPYVGFSQVFVDFIDQILTESPAKIEAWKQKILRALGEQGRVIAEVVPEIELLIGPQPPVRKLGAVENENRFKILFDRLLDAICQEKHPVVIFLDDLHWSDSASLKFMEWLTTEWDCKHLLVIGTYRDNEVGDNPFLLKTIEKIAAAGAVVNSMDVKPLNLFHLRQLVAETLYEDDAIYKQKYSIQLADLLFDKTEGNPFLLTQFLQTLYLENLLVYDPNFNIWNWDIADIQAVGLVDCSAVELIARNISKLPDATQEILQLAACIGSFFELEIMAAAIAESPADTEFMLWEALQAGLILAAPPTCKLPPLDTPSADRQSTSNNTGSLIPSSQTAYKFLHDRVQQTIYGQIPEDRKQAIHLKVGQLLIADKDREEIKENIFAVVKQLNCAIELLESQAEKDELTELNLIAGKKAKASSAYEVAITYLNAGFAILKSAASKASKEDFNWIRNYPLTLELHVELVETEFFNANFGRSHLLAGVVLRQAKTLLDKIKVYEVNIKSYFCQNHLQLAIDTGLRILEMLGCSLEEELLFPEVIVEDLIDLPEMTEPDKLASMQILDAVSSATFVVNPALFTRIVSTKVNLCIKYGNSPLAAVTYADYALLLSGSIGDMNAGYYYGEQALKLLDKLSAKEVKCKVLNTFNAHVRHWKQPLRQTIEPLSEAIQIGVETGDLIFTGIASINYCTHVFYAGEKLKILSNHCENYMSLAVKYRQEYTAIFLKLFQQVLLNLLGKSTSPTQLTGEAFDEQTVVPILKQHNSLTPLFFIFSYKAMLLYLFKYSKQAVDTARTAEQYAGGIPGFLIAAQHNFYYSLALLAEYPNLDSNGQNQCLKKVASLQEKMQEWATHAPSNFQHKYDLVQAEIARILGQHETAMDGYDRAIQGAADNHYIHEAAIASELAFEFHLGRGREKMAKFYLQEAYHSYSRWGAEAKLQDLASKYPHLLLQTAAFGSTETAATTDSKSLGAIDFESFMQASQAISGEIVLSKLVHKLLKIAIQNAGAQKGCLVLVESDNLEIVATGKFSGKDVDVSVLLSEPVQISTAVPVRILNYVWRTQKNLVLDDARCETKFASEPYIENHKLKSVLCAPIVSQGKVIGLLYLENNLAPGMFNPERLEIVKLLASQAATSIENARLIGDLEAANHKLGDYNRDLEDKVREKTQELQENNQQLTHTLQALQQTQAQLIQTEKMSSLGQLVGGIAHEINNPIGFIFTNLTHAQEYTEQLLELIHAYRETYAESTPEIEQLIEDIELDYIEEDFPKIFKSMHGGADRIRSIILSLRNFSRLDESDFKEVDIHEGIESSLLILQHRQKSAGIQTIKEYAKLPLVECYTSQLNQVLMNILSNAIDALEIGFNSRGGAANQPDYPPAIKIRTYAVGDSQIAISIADNGQGMTEEVRAKMFDPFFTTKPVGKGTGLGLSVAYSIVEKHGGTLRCISEPNKGAELIVEIPVKLSNF